MWEQTISLKTTIKRAQVFSRGQRLIVIVSVLISLLAISILYYTPLPLLLVPVALVLNYLLFRRLLVTKKVKTIFVRSLRPLLWLFISTFFFFTVHTISLIVVPLFVACMIFCALVYGVFCYVEIQPERNFLLDNALSLLFILVSTSLASLMVAFWHWPLVIILVLVWALQFLVALWWLLDFTNSPQILAGLWALAVVELMWLSSRWVVLYQIPRIPLILSQLACIVTALAYGWGGIYYHYKKHSLKKAIVFEYLAVTTLVFVALLVVNRWTTTG